VVIAGHRIPSACGWLERNDARQMERMALERMDNAVPWLIQG